jgi:ribonuclease P protein component
MGAQVPKGFGLGRAARIKQNRDFARLRRAGQRATSGCLIANWGPLPAACHSRLGVITSRQLGNSVVRSRARRLLREAFRLHQHELAEPLELVLVARASIVGKPFGQVEKDFLTMLRKTGLLRGAKQAIG